MFSATLGQTTAGSVSTLPFTVPGQSASLELQGLNTSSGGSSSAIPSPTPQVPGPTGSVSALLLPVPGQSVSLEVQGLNINSGGSSSANPSPTSQVPDLADEIFREALERHKLGLSPKQQDLFLTASAVGLMDIVKELDL